jgi:hypothetical protein
MNTTQDTTTTETTEAESFMDRCARERRETATRCAALAAQLAKAMTTPAETWTPKTDEELHYEHFLLIRARDGLELFISGRWSGKNHWHVSLGSLLMPDGTKQSTRDHKRRDEAGETSLNTSKAKTPEQIARDIRRRLWPFADELCARALAHHRKKTDEANRRDAIRERLIKASHYQLEKNDREPARLTKWGTPHIRAEIRTYGSDEVKLEFDATPEQAEQIVAILCQPTEAKAEAVA